MHIFMANIEYVAFTSVDDLNQILSVLLDYYYRVLRAMYCQPVNSSLIYFM